MDTIIQDLYTPRDLVSLVKQALAAKDIALSSLSPKSLAAVDQLHTGGLRASLQLAKGLDLTPDTHILDAGCGLGGTARILAGHCRVTGLDLTPALVEAARTFSHWCDMEDRLHFKTGSITAMPFGDKRFDKVLCQHILMNIEDKPHALLEIHR
ncbi:MAG: class I SAM-dependent methyltransferase, partial [Desulfovibrionales bacterium]|nr:class I SAM-dependent methyltransferase [Desulfovibrionales bacterium]